MATIKSFTSLEQSRKLAEILPLESADMYYVWDYEHMCYTPELFGFIQNQDNEGVEYIDYPCWSLAALISVLPSRLFDATPKRKELYILPGLNKSYFFYRQFAVKTKGKIYLLTEGECLVDACVAMIEKLNGLKML